MKENKAVYVTKYNIREDQLNKQYQYNIRVTRDCHKRNDYDTRDAGVQYNYKKDNFFCTCKTIPALRRHHEVRYFSGQARQVYAYHGSRSYTDVGVGSVKALQRKKIKRIYLPETDDRGVGSSDLSSVYNRRTKSNRGSSYYDHKKTLSKGVGGTEVGRSDATIEVLHEKLSPIVPTQSGSTRAAEGKKINVEIGSNTCEKSLVTISTQMEDNKKQEDVQIEVTTVKVIVEREPSKQIFKDKMSKQILEKVEQKERRISKRAQEAERVFSSDSLVQHIHNLEIPTEEKQSPMSIDPMENKLEREYRKMFCTNSKDSKDPRVEETRLEPELKSTSVLRRRFEALRRGLAKKEDSKKNDNISNKDSSNGSEPSRRDVSIASDPPSLEARSFSNTKIYSPYPSSNRKVTSNPRPGFRRSVTGKKEWARAEEEESENQGVKGMFKLWSKKFNLDDEEVDHTPRASKEAVPNPQKPPEPKLIIKDSQSKKEGKKFFFFKKKSKDKTKQPFKQKKGVTAGRCEVGDGLMIKIGAANSNPRPPAEKERRVSDQIPEEYEEMIRKAWLQQFLARTIDSRHSVKIRWNNNAYATSSSTIFEMMENVYKETGVIFRSRSEITAGESTYYKSYTKQRVNFVQDVEAWMIPNVIPDNITAIPTVNSDESGDGNNNIQVRMSERKWIIDKSKAFAHKIEVVLHSRNVVNMHQDPSFEYLTIDIPKGFFSDSSTDDSGGPIHTSNEEVYKIVEYESPESNTRLKKIKTREVGSNLKDFKVTVSIKDSGDVESKILETVIKTPPVHRDVVIQGSNVYIPKRCNVVGVGIMTQKNMNRLRKPILKIQDDYSEDDSDHSLHISNNKSKFAESYLQDYYRHWTPLGIDFFSWCVSDSHIQCCSDNSNPSVFNQGDGTKSCPNIYDDYHASTVISSCGTSCCSPCVPSWEEECKPGIVSKFCKKFKAKSKSEPGNGFSVLPKDSVEVFKKRKLYALSNKSNWNGIDVRPYSVPSIESRGAPDTLVECPKIKKTCQRQKSSKKSNCKKRVSLPDCEAMTNSLLQMLSNEPINGILSFKGSKNEVCSKKDTCSKQATVIPNATYKIPAPRHPCQEPLPPGYQKASPVKPSCKVLMKPCGSPCGASPRASPPCGSPRRSSSPRASPHCGSPRRSSSPCASPPCYPPPKCPPCPPPPQCPPCPPPPKCPPCPPPPKCPPCPPPPSYTPCPSNNPPCASPPKSRPDCVSPPISQHRCGSPPRPQSVQQSCSSPSRLPCQSPGKSSSGSPCGSGIRLSSPPHSQSGKCKSPKPKRKECSLPGHPRCGSPPVSGINLSSPPRSRTCNPPRKRESPIPCASSDSLNALSSKRQREPPIIKMSPLCPRENKKSRKTPPKCIPTPPSLPSCMMQSPSYPPTPPTPPPCFPVPKPKPPSPCPKKQGSPTPPCATKTSQNRTKAKPKKTNSNISQINCHSPPQNNSSSSSSPCDSSSAPNLIKITSSCCPPTPPKKPKKKPKTTKTSPCAQCSPPQTPPLKKPKETKKTSPCGSLTEDQSNSSLQQPPCCAQKETSKIFPWPIKNQNSNQPSINSCNSNCDVGNEVKQSNKSKVNIIEKIGSLIRSFSNSSSNCKGSGTKQKYERCTPSPPNNTGIHLKMMPPKKQCTLRQCETKQKDNKDAEDTEGYPCTKEKKDTVKVVKPGCLIKKEESDDSIIIKIKKETDSTEEIREGVNIKVKDVDGNTLFERRNYTKKNEDTVRHKTNYSNCGNTKPKKRRPSVLNDMYKNSHVHVVSTSRHGPNVEQDEDIDIGEVKSEDSVTNVIEINFKLKVFQGDKSTELNIETDDMLEKSKLDTQNQTEQVFQQVCLLKDEAEQCTEEVNNKNDINIKIIIKNYKPKSKNKRCSEEFSQNISEKFHTVSTGYSDILSEQNADNAFSVHRATVNLASSNEVSKSQIPNKDVTSEECIEQAPIDLVTTYPSGTEKSGTEPSQSKVDPPRKVKSEVIDIQNLIYEKENTNNEKPANYSSVTDTDEQDLENDLAYAEDDVKISNSDDLIKKALTRDEKKSLLKKVFEKAVKVKKIKNKANMKQFNDMLTLILTDSSDREVMAVPSNELVKEMTYASLKPNFFRDTDSLKNYYKDGSAVSSRHGSREQILNYPTTNVSRCSAVEDSGESSSYEEDRPETCLCSNLAAKLNVAGCCCKNPPKTDEETFCDLRTEEDFLLLNYKTIEYIDVETQNSRYFCNSTNISVHSKAVSGSCRNCIEVHNIKNEETVTIRDNFFKKDKMNSVTQRHPCELKNLNRHTMLGISDEDKVYLLNAKPTTVSMVKDNSKMVRKGDLESLKRRKRTFSKCERPADILQSYETKKAVLEIYAESTKSNEGERMVAKLPKFVYHKESEIERNYEEYAEDMYGGVNSQLVMSIRR